MTDLVFQGDTWGSMLASVQVDTIRIECLERGYGYRYKDTLMANTLGMVDALIGITEANGDLDFIETFNDPVTMEKTTF